MKRILYITNLVNTFTEIDRKILQSRYNVDVVHVTKRDPRLFWQFWQQTQSVDAVVAWFASWHSLPAFVAAQLRGIPRLLISGGYDIANEPDIGYGLQRGGITKQLSGIVFRLATHTALFSDYSYKEALANTPLKPKNTSTIYLGVPDIPEFAQPTEKEIAAFTVGTIDVTTLWRKGIQPFVEAAHFLPDVPFIVAGRAKDNSIEQLKSIAPPNVQFTGFMSDDDLIALRQRAKVYVQVSRHEGFGLAVAESMLARCIPVVSRYGSLPEVVGETGIYIDAIEPQKIADAIQTALHQDATQGEEARQSILTHFPLEQRAEKLYAALDKLMS